MHPIVSAVTLAALIAVGLSGCGNKQRDELRAQVDALEQHLAQATRDAAAKEAELVALRNRLRDAQAALSQAQTQVEGLSLDLEQTLVELDRTQRELEQRKKKLSP